MIVSLSKHPKRVKIFLADIFGFFLGLCELLQTFALIPFWSYHNFVDIITMCWLALWL